MLNLMRTLNTNIQAGKQTGGQADLGGRCRLLLFTFSWHLDTKQINAPSLSGVAASVTPAENVPYERPLPFFY